MSSCNNYALAGISNDCSQNVGGIKVVYIAPKDDVSAITGTKINSAITAFSYDNMEMVTGITMQTGKKFKEYYFRKNTGSLTKTLTLTDEGNSYVASEIALRFSRMNTTKRLEMRALTLNECIVIVKDANNTYWLIGDPDDPVTASAGTGESGTNRDDSNAYTITLGAETTYWPIEIDSTTITSDIIDFNN